MVTDEDRIERFCGFLLQDIKRKIEDPEVMKDFERWCKKKDRNIAV